MSTKKVRMDRFDLPEKGIVIRDQTGKIVRDEHGRFKKKPGGSKRTKGKGKGKKATALRADLIRYANTLPTGSEERKALLAILADED